MRNTLFDEISACRIVLIYKIFIVVLKFSENENGILGVNCFLAIEVRSNITNNRNVNSI
jgi:hypothetical protein